MIASSEIAQLVEAIEEASDLGVGVLDLAFVEVSEMLEIVRIEELGVLRARHLAMQQNIAVPLRLVARVQVSEVSRWFVGNVRVEVVHPEEELLGAPILSSQAIARSVTSVAGRVV